MKSSENKSVSFTSIYSGESETYTIKDSGIEAITDVSCPIDGTKLIQVETTFDPFYRCPNCGFHYDNWTSEYLQKEKAAIIKTAKERFSDADRLVKLVKFLDSKK